MKSKLLFAGLITLGLTSKAQFGQQGQRLITAGLSAYQSKSTIDPNANTNSEGVNLNFSLGKFTKQHVLTNFTVFGGFFNNKNESFTNYDRNKGYNVGGSFSKTYYKPIVKNLFVGLGGIAGVNYSSSEYTLSTSGTPLTDIKRYGINLALVPSLSYQFSKRFVANLSPGNTFLQLSYMYTDAERKGTGITTVKSTQQDFNLGAGFWSAPLQNLSISFSYLLKNK